MAGAGFTVAESLGSTATLNDGVTMPLFGLGTYKMPVELTEDAVTFALQQGYRLVDTGQVIYGNEAEVGRALQRCGVPRDQIFVVSKVFTSNMGREACVQSVKDSLKALQLDYADQFLIHAPGQGKVLETYDALLDLKTQGLIRSVGVSNFNMHHLEGLRKAGRPLPSVNQIELHPFFHQQAIVDYCLEHDIGINGYSPLARMEKQPDMLKEMATRYGRTVAQVLIRWSVQRAYITIPMAETHDKILEDSRVFDFSISQDDMKAMDSLPSHQCAWDPMSWPWEG